MAEMRREDFIAMMIAELTLQKSNNEDSFNNIQTRGPKEIFQSMCFDFPLVTSEEMLTLAKEVVSFASAKSTNVTYDTFWLNDKFTENLMYLSSKAADNKDDELAISSLCAAVYLRLPLRLLSMTRSELSDFFCGISSEAESKQSNISNLTSGEGILSWVSICQKFCSFIRQGTASLLCNVQVAALLGDKNCTGGHLADLSESIIKMQDDSTVKVKSVNQKDPSLITLEECFISNRELALKEELDEDKTISLINSASDTDVKNNLNESSEPSECSVINGMAKDIWVHLSFLSRDVLVQHSELLNNPSVISKALGVLIPLGTSYTMTSSSFPSAKECMLALTLAGVAAGITASTASTVSSRVLSSTPREEEAGLAGVIESAYARNKLRDQKCSEARSGLRQYLNSSTPSILTLVVGICERMKNTGGVNSDGAVLLYDIIPLYSEITKTVPHPHEHLMTSRALSVLVQMWISMTSLALALDNASGIVGTSDPQSSIPVTGSKSSSMLITASRIMQTLDLLILQRAETAIYISKIPNFLSTVYKAVDSWKTLDRLDDGGRNSGIIWPGDAVGLFAGLLLASEPLSPSTAKSSTELMDGLKMSLNMVGKDISVILTARHTQKKRNTVSTLEKFSSTITDNLHENNKKQIPGVRSRVSQIPQGIIQTLRVMTSKECGGKCIEDLVYKYRGKIPHDSTVCVLKNWTVKMLTMNMNNNGNSVVVNSQALSQQVNITELTEGSEQNVRTSTYISSSPADATDKYVPSSTSGVESDAVGVIGESVHAAVVAVHQTVGEDVSSSGDANDIDSNEIDEDDSDLEDSEAMKENEVKKDNDDDDDDEAGSSSSAEEIRRLIKALQAVLDGLSTSKVD